MKRSDHKQETHDHKQERLKTADLSAAFMGIKLFKSLNPFHENDHLVSDIGY